MTSFTDEPAEIRTRDKQMVLSRVRSWVVTPRGLAVAGVGAVVIGLAINWNWLVVVGAAPIILSLAPCAAMCALGLCMGMGQRSDTAVVKPSSDPVAEDSLTASTRVDGST